MKKVVFVFLLIFSLLIISGVEYRCEVVNDSFSMIEKNMIEKCDFDENGIKLEYTSESSLENELNRIKKILADKVNLNLSIGENCISIKGENINYSVNMYYLKDILKVEVIILNYDKEKNQKDLKILAQEIRGNKFIEERYFSFVKGKIKTDDKEVINNIKNQINMNLAETVEISNGYTIKSFTKENVKINISKVDYDTGSYLIIGTPIIFVTY